jgi:hypothetical protein
VIPVTDGGEDGGPEDRSSDEESSGNRQSGEERPDDGMPEETFGGQVPDGARLHGEVLVVESVPVDTVPDEFPGEFSGEEVLALDVDIRFGEETTTYLSAEEDNGPLEALLETHGASAPADLEGAGLLLEARNGYWVPLSRDGPRRGDDRAVYGVLAGLAPSITIALFNFFGVGGAAFSPLFLALWGVCTFLVLPVSMYVDAWHLRSTTDWEGGPARWTLVSVVPPLYVVVVPYYLVKRANARPLVLETAGEHS